MKKKAISSLVVFAVACMAIATCSKMLPKIAFAESAQAQQQANEERAIWELNAAVEAGWNKHDAAAMDQSFVEDCDLVNVFGEWISGHDKLVKIHTALFAGPLRDSYQRMNVEKVRFVRPDVAVVHVRHHNTDRDGKVLAGDEGAMGTVVFAKEQGKWWIIAAQNTIVRPLPEAFEQAGKPPAP
jgi:uncharacterized protein (TIGR02246 family)